MLELTTEETQLRKELQKALDEAKAKVRSGENAVEIKSSSWTKYEPPFKQRIGWETGYAAWARTWNGTRRDLTERFRRLGPITPDIAAKFANALKFFDAGRAGTGSVDESDQSQL